MGLSHNFAEGSGIYWPEKIVKPQKSHRRWRRQRPQIFNFLSKFPIFWGFWLFSPSKWLSTAKSGKEFLKYRLFWVWESWRICHRIFERNRRIFGKAVLLSNVHKYFSYLILKWQISDKNYWANGQLSNVSKYLHYAGIILDDNRFYQRFALNIGGKGPFC